VLHIVRAGPEALRVLRADGLPRAGGMVHGCSLAADLVPAYLALGLQLSFGSAITRSGRAAAALRAVPDDRLLLETDCPDQPLHPGTRGEPADLPSILAAAAALRGRPVIARRPW
jgi:TatD DNase family protein